MQCLNLPAFQHLYKTVTNHFYALYLPDKIKEFAKSCDTRPRFKLPGIACGEFDLMAQPWGDIAFDSIGPGTIKVHGVELQFLALTAIDTVKPLLKLFTSITRHLLMLQ
jgi:hypothetical protein